MTPLEFILGSFGAAVFIAMLAIYCFAILPGVMQ
jgi:hypothetical protein